MGFGQQLSLEWYQKFGFSGWDFANDIERLDNGTFLVAGSLDGEMGSDTSFLRKNMNAWIAAIDSNGAIAWQKVFKGNEFETVTSISKLQEGLLLTGLFQDTITYDSASLVSDTYMSGFLALIDSYGNLTWLNKIGTKGIFNNIFACSNQSDKSFIAVSYSDSLILNNNNFSGIGNSGIVISELLPDGNLINPLQILCTGDLTLSGIDCNNSTFCVAGSFTDTLSIADTSIISTGLEDSFIASYDHLGNLKWINSITGNGNENISDIVVAVDGKVGITGSFDRNSFYDEQVLQSFGSRDIIVALLNSDGDFLWGKNMGSISNDYGHAIQINEHNDLYVSGSFTNIMGIPDENGTIIEMESFSPFGNSFIAKYNEDGVLKASYTLPGTSEDYCKSLVVDSIGKITTVGNFHEKMQLQNTDGQIIEIVSSGDKDVFMLYFDDMCRDFSIDAGEDTLVCPEQSIQLVPLEAYTTFIWEPGGVINQYIEVDDPGIFHLTATNQYGCIAKDSLQVFQGSMPLVYAGNDTIMEAGQSLDLFSAYGNNSDAWQWNTSGDGFFGNNQALNTYYSMSNTDISSGNLIVTLTGSNGCGTVSDSINVTVPMDDDGVTVYPNPTQGLVTVICEDELTIQSITITTQTGFLIISGQTVNNMYFEYDLSSYPPGSFLFYMTTNNGIVTKLVNKI